MSKLNGKEYAGEKLFDIIRTEIIKQHAKTRDVAITIKKLKKWRGTGHY